MYLRFLKHVRVFTKIEKGKRIKHDGERDSIFEACERTARERGVYDIEEGRW
jgi:hypothetical protein